MKADRKGVGIIIGFVILTPLVKSISRKTKRSVVGLGCALACRLFVTHHLVPPTPGPLGVAAIFGADLGQVILWGLVVSIYTLAGKETRAEAIKKMEEGVESAGIILLITGAGGAFGYVIRTAGMGAMAIGHFNDSFFWVVNRMLGITETKEQLKTWTVPTIVMWLFG